jgi:NifB/MoaA-like Fe-S oxidoreductase
LRQLHIAVHAQVVLCPDINDGPHLERTLADLRRLYPSVQSVSLVPVGLTRFRRPSPGSLEGGSLRAYTPNEARALLRWARPHQRAFRRELDCDFLYPADEFYLLAGRAIPSARRYDGFPQLENGVGMVRQLLDDWAQVRRKLRPLTAPPPAPPVNGGGVSASLATGALLAPVLQKMAQELSARLPGVELEVRPIENVTFGPSVTVAGLLTGEALQAGLRTAQGKVLFLPAAAFGDQGRTLDDVTVDMLEQTLGRPIVLVEWMSEVVSHLELLRATHTPPPH